MSQLFSPAQFANTHVKNRIFMAPLTRSRAERNGVPTDLHISYYQQRATAGMIISEGVFLTDNDRAFLGQPGIITEEQKKGWEKVIKAVHEAGSTIALQIMHGGRLTLPSINDGTPALAPSAIAPGITLHGANGREEVPVPFEASLEQLESIKASFVTAARNAIDAGADAVEVHGANGYLLHEFLAPNSNQRTDKYGGSPENRAAFVIEVVRAVASEIGAEKTALRISPEHLVQGMEETDQENTVATYGALLDSLSDLKLAYLSVLHHDPAGELVTFIRNKFSGFIVFNNGFATETTRQDAEAILNSGNADAVAVGRNFIANPDLPYRWENDLELNIPDDETFYTPGAKGYTDYPFAS